MAEVLSQGGNCGEGGGATDVRTAADDLTSRITVAGGDGGASSWENEGNGGGLIGGDSFSKNTPKWGGSGLYPVPNTGGTQERGDIAYSPPPELIM